jgi:hypothetical protein
MYQQDVDVFLLNGPLRDVLPAVAERCRHAIEAELRRAQVDAVQFHPLAGDPALEAENAKLGIGAVVVRQAREQQRRQALPARVRGLLQRFLQRRLISIDEALRKIVDRLPDALRPAWARCRSSRRTAW